ncbi:MAG TPA: carboxypeptidase-like regulatory domain-containing protein [Gemmatimonadaceae bacterium]|nr:carboxypeptidase-like regulatory domain-containing protein [Gemmatimonadaceae bacterium]
MRGVRATFVGLALAVCASASVARGAQGQGQILRGVLRDSVSQLAISGAVVTLLDNSAAPVGRTISNERGQFRFVLLTSAVRRIRVVRLGFRPAEVAVAADRDLSGEIRITLVAIPMALQPVAITANPRCARRRDHTLALALLEQARAGLLATVVAPTDKPARVKRLRATRTKIGESDRVVHQRVKTDSAGGVFGAFGAARTAGDFVDRGFMEDSAGENVFYGPDAEVLLDDRFASGYCFRIMDRVRDRPNQVGLGFRAADRKDGRIDVEGALWIDTVARALVDIEYRYIGVDSRMEPFDPGGRIFFRTMPNGVPLIDHWVIRLVGAEPPPARRLFGIEVWGELARASWPDSTHWQGTLGSLRATLVNHDGTPAPGAVIRLDDTDYIAVADSAGVAEIVDLVPGPYRLSFVDPDLAELNVEVASPQEFTAVRGTPVVRRLTVRTAESYVSERCHSNAKTSADSAASRDGSAWLIGRITDARGEPIEAAIWTLSYHDSMGDRRLFERVAVGSDGIFQFCRLQHGATVVVHVQAKGMQDAKVTATLTRQPTIVTVEMKPRD